jgi:hypothetical protein
MGKKTKINGISGSAEFWAEVDRRAKESGQTRSALIVEELATLWKLPGLVTGPVGRPKRKVVKRVTC